MVCPCVCLVALGLYDTDLTGSVAQEICDNVFPNGNIEYLWTDCGTNYVVTEPQVVCDCCDFCYEGRAPPSS